MFVDVGAGTVDASTFIYWPGAQDGKTLSYLSAEVIALGSSQIELRAAAELAARLQREFRHCKEGTSHKASVAINTATEVERVCSLLSEELLVALTRCAGLAYEKLVTPQRHGRPQQWNELQIILGGGGSVLEMYPRAASHSFNTWTMHPNIFALPVPLDLDWPVGNIDRAAIFLRMTVAYGLSFDFPTLAQHRFPDEITQLDPDDEPRHEPYRAPSKDEV